MNRYQCYHWSRNRASCNSRSRSQEEPHPNSTSHTPIGYRDWWTKHLEFIVNGNNLHSVLCHHLCLNFFFLCPVQQDMTTLNNPIIIITSVATLFCRRILGCRGYLLFLCVGGALRHRVTTIIDWFIFPSILTEWEDLRGCFLSVRACVTMSIGWV